MVATVRRFKKHRLMLFIFLFLIILVIMARIFLSYFLLNYITHQINKIPEYKVKIADLDINLWRGSYTLKNIQLWKVTANLPVPFFEAQAIDFSVQWSAILHGRFVAKIITQNPTVNFVTDPNNHNEQLSIDDYWLTIVKSLFPLNINRLDVHDGIIYFRSYKGNPPFIISVKNIEFFIENMQKIKKGSILPSTFSFIGDPSGGGKMRIDGKYNPFDKQPTFDLKATIGSLSIAKIAPLLKHYTDIKVVGGSFSLYGEAAAADGAIKGYAKPFIKNLKIGDTDNSNPFEAIYEGLVAGVAKILENSQTKTIATKINISGRIDNPDTSIWSIIGYLLRHAFIQALIPQVDNSVKIQDVIYNKPPSNKNFPLFRQ